MTRSAIITKYKQINKINAGCNSLPLLRNAMQEGNRQIHVRFMKDACFH